MKFASAIPLALALILGCVGPALAKKDVPGPDWTPVEQVKQKLMDAGYTSVTKVRPTTGIGKARA